MLRCDTPLIIKIFYFCKQYNIQQKSLVMHAKQSCRFTRQQENLYELAFCAWIVNILLNLARTTKEEVFIYQLCIKEQASVFRLCHTVIVMFFMLIYKESKRCKEDHFPILLRGMNFWHSRQKRVKSGIEMWVSFLQ